MFQCAPGCFLGEFQSVPGCPRACSRNVPGVPGFFFPTSWLLQLPLLSAQHLVSVAAKGPINMSLIIALMQEKARRARASWRRISGCDGPGVHPQPGGQIADKLERKVLGTSNRA